MRLPNPSGKRRISSEFRQVTAIVDAILNQIRDILGRVFRR